MKALILRTFVLAVFACSQAWSAAVPKPMVVLDPGHGGVERGVRVGGLEEATYTLSLALKVAESLKKSGMDARLTRDSDIQLNAASRTAVANQAGVRAFISLHVNYSYNGQARGLRVFVPAPGPVDEPLAPLWEQASRLQAIPSKALGQAIAGAMGETGGKSVQSLKLALFRGLGVPAAQVEIDYASNPPGLAGLSDQGALAEKLARGIGTFVLGPETKEAAHAPAKP